VIILSAVLTVDASVATSYRMMASHALQPMVGSAQLSLQILFTR